MQNSRNIGPYILLDKGTTCLETITILFSLNFIRTPHKRDKFTLVRTIKALCMVPTLNLFWNLAFNLIKFFISIVFTHMIIISPIIEILFFIDFNTFIQYTFIIAVLSVAFKKDFNWIIY